MPGVVAQVEVLRRRQVVNLDVEGARSDVLGVSSLGVAKPDVVVLDLADKAR
jgi:hypothetical protein